MIQWKALRNIRGTYFTFSPESLLGPYQANQIVTDGNLRELNSTFFLKFSKVQ